MKRELLPLLTRRLDHRTDEQQKYNDYTRLPNQACPICGTAPFVMMMLYAPFAPRPKTLESQ